MKAMKYSFAVVLVAILFVTGCGSSDGVKEFEQAKAALESRDLKKAEKFATKSVALKPDDVDRLLLHAQIELELGDLSAAKASIEHAALLAPDDFDVLLIAGQVAWHLKDYARAAESFSRVANDKKLDADIRSQGWCSLGVVEFACNNHHLARVDFFNAIQCDRRNAAAWYHLGCLYRDGFGYTEAALEQFEFFVRLEKMADLRVQKVQQTVIPALKEAIASAAANRPGASKRNSAASASAIARAEGEWKKGAFKSARKSYQQALAEDALSYPAALGLAQAWEKTDGTKNGMSNALECYQTACSLRPSAISTFLKAGALAVKLGLSTQAAEIYSRALAANPTSLDAIDGLIVALRKTGKAKVSQAYQQYRTSLPKRKSK